MKFYIPVSEKYRPPVMFLHGSLVVALRGITSEKGGSWGSICNPGTIDILGKVNFKELKELGLYKKT